jgi:hypothetical protein
VEKLSELPGNWFASHTALRAGAVAGRRRQYCDEFHSVIGPLSNQQVRCWRCGAVERMKFCVCVCAGIPSWENRRVPRSTEPTGRKSRHRQDPAWLARLAGLGSAVLRVWAAPCFFCEIELRGPMAGFILIRTPSLLDHHTQRPSPRHRLNTTRGVCDNILHSSLSARSTTDLVDLDLISCSQQQNGLS